MPRRLRYAQSLTALLLLLLCATHARAAQSPLVIEGVGDATAQLGGPWQFHLGDNIGWASPLLDDTRWDAIGVDKSWGEQGHAGYIGYAWYRRHVTFKPASGAKTDFAVFVPPVDDAYELYWNGVLIGKSGKLPPHPVWYFRAPYRSFFIGQPQSGVLALRVWKAPYLSFDSGLAGGPSQPPLIGGTEAIQNYVARLDLALLQGRLYEYGTYFLYTLVTLFSLLAWLRNRKVKILFWMAIFAAAPVVAQVLLSPLLGFSILFGVGVLQPVLGLEDISLWFLLLYLLQLDTAPRLLRWTRTLAVIMLVCSSLDGLLSLSYVSTSSTSQALDALLTAFFTIAELFPLVLIWFALKKRLDAARWLLAIAAFLRDFIIILRTTLDQGQRYTHWTWGDKLARPLFTIAGNRITVVALLSTTLFIAIVYAIYRYTVEQGQRQSALEQEFRSAQELQRVLIPENLPAIAGYSVTSAYRPAEEVGGDFFQLIPVAGGATLLILGDVSGKGLKAAMTVSLIVGAARTLAEISASPAEILAGLNRRLYGRVRDGFVTCLVMRFASDGLCTIANAGHPSPFLNAQELTTSPALPLGLAIDVDYDESQIHLQVADRLTLYTDGLLEARNAKGELYSFDRLQPLIATLPDAQQASEAAIAFGQEDDITVLTVTRLATGVASTTYLSAPALVSANA